MGLYEKLIDYSRQDFYPMHMPGHKRNREWLMRNLYSIDITEIEGFDNLHNPSDVLKDCMQRAARIYESSKTYYLVGGCSSGVLTAISSCTKSGDTILIARNSHKSVYNAILLNQLKVEYIYPEVDKETGILGSISPEAVSKKLDENSKISLVVITSPTYEGVSSDIKRIAQITHARKIPLFVDAAHGAHLGFHSKFPKNAICDGADLVVHGIHKTLPALTQTALLHVNGNLVNRKEMKRYYSVFQSTSPSYPLLAGIDRCILFLEQSMDIKFRKFTEELDEFYGSMKALKHLKVWKPQQSSEIFDYDYSKIIIYTGDSNITGSQLYSKLISHYHIQPEMVSKDYVLCITSLCDSSEGFERLRSALLKMDSLCSKRENNEFSASLPPYLLPKRRFHYHEVIGKQEKWVSLMESKGCILAEFIYLYPPGIPFIVPGEVMSLELLSKLLDYQKAGLKLCGLDDESGTKVRVLY